MKVSQNLINLLKSFEGCVLHSYLDVADVPTIGWGSTMYKNQAHVQMGETITQEEADDLLLWEISEKTSRVNSLIRVAINQNQYDAIVDFAYNVGTGGLQSSTLLKKVNANPSDPTIRDEFMKWSKAHVNGKLVVVEGLRKRRKKEADLYFTV